MNIKVVTFGARETAIAFAAAPTALKSRIGRSVRSTGSQLRTRVRANASGRTGNTYTDPDGGPAGIIGPRVQTGDYRRSIGLQTGTIAGDTAYAEVGTNAPQGRRLELGFVGQDSLGRHYNQPPYPHFRPAVPLAEEALARALEGDIDWADRTIGGR